MVVQFEGCDKKLFLACIGGSILAYNAARLAGGALLAGQKTEWVPIGTVKHLRLFPIKSCKAKEVFSFFCGSHGASLNAVFDRSFMVVNGETGKFYTARQHPMLVLLEGDIFDGLLKLKKPGGAELVVDMHKVVSEKKRLIRTKLHGNLEADGIDCGDAAAEFIASHIGENVARLVFYTEGLYNGRVCETDQDWWKNNPVPKRKDTVAYADLAPYMITTEASLEDLNSRLDKKVTSMNFRANIVVDKCTAWDEDKWLDLRFGESADSVELQCFKPCTRCVLTTVDPVSGVKDVNMQPLRELRAFRLAPEGKMRAVHGDSPIFGVNAGLLRPGYIHVGQTVWAKYKPSVF